MRMTPSRFHVPPEPVSGQMVTGEPPETSTFCRVRFEKNAICRPSGDQKGQTAPPGIGISVAVSAFRGRTNNLSFAIVSEDAVKAMRSPSGDTAGKSNQ